MLGKLPTKILVQLSTTLQSVNCSWTDPGSESWENGLSTNYLDHQPDAELAIAPMKPRYLIL